MSFLWAFTGNCFAVPPVSATNEHLLVKYEASPFSEGIIEPSSEICNAMQHHQNVVLLKNIFSNVTSVSALPKTSEDLIAYLWSKNRYWEEIPEYLLNRNLLI
ncbi:MAG TPA: hypothetical protein VF868_07935 [Bacteroidia bacterium]